MKYLLILVVFLATFLANSCSKQSADQAELKEIEIREDLPIWSKSDFDYQGTVLVYNVEINEKPPYYRGRMPLIFEQSQLPIPSYTIVLKYEFNDYVVMFTRNGPIYKGACATDKSGTKLLAEARIKYFVTEDKRQGIEAEEFHYDQNGQLIFYCKSQLKQLAMYMFKQSESERLGKKDKDYFFLWPGSF